MLRFVVKRLLIVIPMLVAISFLTFVLIQLPPGDFLTAEVAQMRINGDIVDQQQIDWLRETYGLDQPLLVQYFQWVKNIVLHGDLGFSFMWKKPVNDLIGERILMTLALSLATLIFTYLVAIPIGIYSAIKQYSWFDYVSSGFAFIGMATPSFTLALILMIVMNRCFGISIGGLFSREFVSAPWNWAKFGDMCKHMITPMIVLGTSGTAEIIRVMRSQLLDEIKKLYVTTARSKGVGEAKLTLKYPIRAALLPIISTIGWMLPSIFSGATITAVVLSLPTEGPLLLSSLLDQDMYLAGSFLLIEATLTVIGTMISDILTAWLDPQTRIALKN